MESSLNTGDIYYRRMTLCDSLAGNPCDVITITAQPRRKDAETLEMLSKSSGKNSTHFQTKDEVALLSLQEVDIAKVV